MYSDKRWGISVHLLYKSAETQSIMHCHCHCHHHLRREDHDHPRPAEHEGQDPCHLLARSHNQDRTPASRSERIDAQQWTEVRPSTWVIRSSLVIALRSQPQTAWKLSRAAVAPSRPRSQWICIRARSTRPSCTESSPSLLGLTFFLTSLIKFSTICPIDWLDRRRQSE